MSRSTNGPRIDSAGDAARDAVPAAASVTAVDPPIMDQSEKFSDYLFAKMGPPLGVGNGDAECPRKTTDSCEAPVELTGARKWLSENLMLLLTLSGVLLGVVLGE